MAFVETEKKEDFTVTFLCQEKAATIHIHGDLEQREQTWGFSLWKVPSSCSYYRSWILKVSDLLSILMIC